MGVAAAMQSTPAGVWPPVGLGYLVGRMGVSWRPQRPSLAPFSAEAGGGNGLRNLIGTVGGNDQGQGSSLACKGRVMENTKLGVVADHCRSLGKLGVVADHCRSPGMPCFWLDQACPRAVSVRGTFCLANWDANRSPGILYKPDWAWLSGKNQYVGCLEYWTWQGWVLNALLS
jgi:hypothetical protein